MFYKLCLNKTVDPTKLFIPKPKDKTEPKTIDDINNKLIALQENAALLERARGIAGVLAAILVLCFAASAVTGPLASIFAAGRIGKSGIFTNMQEGL